MIGHISYLAVFCSFLVGVPHLEFLSKKSDSALMIAQGFFFFGRVL